MFYNSASRLIVNSAKYPIPTQVKHDSVTTALHNFFSSEDNEIDEFVTTKPGR